MSNLRDAAAGALEAIRIFREWEMGQDYESDRDTVLARAFAAEEALEAALAEPQSGWDGDDDIASPFNACMHKGYCLTLKAQVAPQRTPLTDDEIDAAYRQHEEAQWLVASAWSFEAGVRWAEKSHGITGEQK